MENTGIKRYEDYTENCENHYRLPNTSTMENLSMKVTAGEGAVLKMGDKVPLLQSCKTTRWTSSKTCTGQTRCLSKRATGKRRSSA